MENKGEIDLIKMEGGDIKMVEGGGYFNRILQKHNKSLYFYSVFRDDFKTKEHKNRKELNLWI